MPPGGRMSISSGHVVMLSECDDSNVRVVELWGPL